MVVDCYRSAIHSIDPVIATGKKIPNRAQRIFPRFSGFALTTPNPTTATITEITRSVFSTAALPANTAHSIVAMNTTAPAISSQFGGAAAALIGTLILLSSFLNSRNASIWDETRIHRYRFAERK